MFIKVQKIIKEQRYLLLFIVLSAIGFSLFGYLLFQYQSLKNNPDEAAQLSQEQNQQLVTKLSKIIVLPTNETPEIATITDINKLKNQSFFSNAQDGDKLLIYIKAKQVVLYDPQANKIINIGPLNSSN